MTDEEENKWPTNRLIDEALFHACSTASVAEVRSLLDRGADPNTPYYPPKEDGDGLPELDAEYCIHEAARNKDMRVLELLVERGVNPNQTTFWGLQPLAYAVGKNSLEMVKRLIELGNKADREDLDGGSVMSMAALNPDVRVLEYLMAHGAVLDWGASSESELGQAVRDGTPERVRFFLDHGARIQISDEFIREAPLENLRILLEAGYDPDTVTDSIWDSERQIGHPHRLVEGLDPERQALFAEFGAKRAKVKGNGMVKVRIYSFSYPKGLPEDRMGHGGGFVFDCRCLPNPYWTEGLRKFSGQDEPIREFFAEHRDEVEAFLGAVEALVRQTTATYLADGRRHLMVSFGCTGGQHRSVFMAEELARRLQGMPGVETEVRHMEKDRWKGAISGNG
jgi:hypothetical protein